MLTFFVEEIFLIFSRKRKVKAIIRKYIASESARLLS